MPKFDEYLKELITSRAAEAPAWLTESKDDYEANEIIQELNKLDEKFYTIIDRKTFLDSATLLNEKKINRMNLANTMDPRRYLDDINGQMMNMSASDMMDHANLLSGKENGTLMASEVGVNWLDNVSDEAMDCANEQKEAGLYFIIFFIPCQCINYFEIQNIKKKIVCFFSYLLISREFIWNHRPEW